MKYISVAETAKKWNISERSVRNYCAQGRVPDAFLTGKTWNIPENAKKPERANKRVKSPRTLLDILQEEKAKKYSGGIYHKTQIELTYNSNHMEGSKLTHDQTRYIFETNTIGMENEVFNVDDIIETANHFRCMFYYPSEEYLGCLMTEEQLMFYDEINTEDLFEGKNDREKILIFSVD